MTLFWVLVTLVLSGLARIVVLEVVLVVVLALTPIMAVVLLVGVVATVVEVVVLLLLPRAAVWLPEGWGVWAQKLSGSPVLRLRGNAGLSGKGA